ncbi:hypothetical protein LCGC14_0388050 [marine sediment metagenome]|uniref:Phage ABA sandwich domain-containing protein n=1 Tax=marine sediment metagenome TaxID=412755 RepID=A0A0F9W9L2_9ZZZZ
MEPTQEQIKEFWEACGLHHYVSPKEKISYEDNHWIAPDGTKYSGYPPIDLNNLFKYAVPKAIRDNGLFSIDAMWRDKGIEGTCWRTTVFFSFYSEGVTEGEGNTFALALFWALWEVKEVSK